MNDALRSGRTDALRIDSALVAEILRPRARDAHKGTYGTVLIAAGSLGMAGAAVLCARGALRSGAGLVRVSLDETLFAILQTSVPEATCVGPALSPETLKTFRAAAAGPGLGITGSARTIGSDGTDIAARILAILRHVPGTIVLDADALTCLASDSQLRDAVRAIGDRVILSPHPGEAGRLLGMSAAEINRDRIAAARQMAEQSGAIIVLKGAGTVVTAPGRPFYVNTTGNPGMATGGSGDVLAGILAGFAAQGIPPFEAALAGVYIHGRAGDLAADALGEYGLIASDIAALAGRAIREIPGAAGGPAGLK